MTTSQTFSRKWRPGSFSDLVGQEHISTTLKNAIKLNRVSHGYLFTGPRGTGKTSSARIFAKAINCTHHDEGDPCNQCITCKSINENRNMDIIELDAASNRGIDEIRSIVEKINFMPSQSKKKIYIIDEAHMLTNTAANAFLKTLEEPPNHVIFILCTTEIQNIMSTIVSRCQRYDFKRITNSVVVKQLEKIAAEEQIKVNEDALHMISKNTAGSLRDAENLFEQVAVAYNNDVNIKNVEDLLGIVDEYTFIPFIKALLTRDVSQALSTINEYIWDGIELKIIHKQTLDMFVHAVKLLWGADDVVDMVDDAKQALSEIIETIDNVQLFHAINIWSEIDIRRGNFDSVVLELAAAKICKQEPVTEKIQSVNVPSQQARRNTSPQRRNTSSQQRRPSTSNRASASSEKTNIAADNNSNKTNIDLIWKEITVLLAKENNTSYNIAAILRNYSSINISESNDSVLIKYDNICIDAVRYILQDDETKDKLVKSLKDRIDTIQDINIDTDTKTDENHIINHIRKYGGVPA